MLENFTVDTFRSLLDSDFLAHCGDGEPATLTLLRADTLGASAGTRQPFSLMFQGPVEPILPQRIYPFYHPNLGKFEIFIVPIGQDGAGTLYEAIFT